VDIVQSNPAVKKIKKGYIYLQKVMITRT
jgi:hypothetical protein